MIKIICNDYRKSPFVYLLDATGKDVHLYWQVLYTMKDC